MTFYYDGDNPLAPAKISLQLKKMLKNNYKESQPLLIMCIGSDRVSGDSLGPLIGYKLSYYCDAPFYIYGNLSAPVHGANLAYTLSKIDEMYTKPYIIAIDASLGSPEHVGFITLGSGCLKPGLGVKKKLPEVGNVHITGIVSNSCNNDNSKLSTTRLYTIMHLADVITSAIVKTFTLKPYSYILPMPELLSAPVQSEEYDEAHPIFLGH